MIVGWDGSVSARQAAKLTEAQLASLPEKSILSLVRATSLTLIGGAPALPADTQANSSLTSNIKSLQGGTLSNRIYSHISLVKKGREDCSFSF